QRFGPELLAFFHAVLRNEADAEECFGQFCEEFWRGLHRFRRECGPRTWCYVLARRTLCRYRETLNRRRKRFVSLSRIPKKLRLVAVRVRTSTLAYLRTEAKDKLARLREQLTADQQMLLVLRVDRNLSWNQIARIMEGLETVEDEELRQRAAALRKQFQRIKEKLSKLAKREGMLEPE
ncbi:MAG: sigma-70 family RNA polymerase sigma factor, partial [Deltaproteobacteria bacterium]